MHLFQSSLPQGERHGKNTEQDIKRHFNPRSHKGSDTNDCDDMSKKAISILAPTRGATVFSYYLPFLSKISILAPTRGATRLGAQYRICGRNFNPRSHKGSDRNRHARFFMKNYFNPRSHKWSDIDRNGQHQLCAISIHAPTSGATGYRQTTGRVCVDFNPRSHKWSDYVKSLIFSSLSNFNPRSHKWSDPFVK